MPLPPVVALEIGTSKTVALVGEQRDDDQIMITGIGEHPSTGVRKSEIIDLDNALVCARSALQAAEESAQVTIRELYLALSGGHIQSVVHQGSVPVLNPHGEITSHEVEQVMNIARAVSLRADCEPIHTICQNFCIDERDEVQRPEGLEGAKLSLNMLILYGVRTRMHNTVRVVRTIPLEVADAAFSGLCAGLAVLTPEQKEGGVLLIDIGGGTTSYLAYARNALSAAGAIGVGGDHVTNDIALAFSIPMRQAEHVKHESGNAIVDFATRTRRLTLPAEVGFPGRTITMDSLHLVINARMDETLAMIKTRIESAGLMHHLGAGVVLTGGGAKLAGITELAERIFGMPCCIGTPKGVSGLTAEVSGPEYATPIGLVRFGCRSLTGGRKGGWRDRIGKMLGIGKPRFSLL